MRKNTLLSKILILVVVVHLVLLYGCGRVAASNVGLFGTPLSPALLSGGNGDALTNADSITGTLAGESPGFSSGILGGETKSSSVTLEAKLEYAEDAFHTVSVTYDEHAGIPSDARLVLECIDPTEDQTQLFHDSLGLGEGDVVLFDTLIRVSFTTADGEEIQPNAPVEVVVDTGQIPPAQSDATEAVVLGDEPGDDKMAVPLVRNLTGQYEEGKENLDPRTTRVQLTCDRLGELGLATVLSPVEVVEESGETLIAYVPRNHGAATGVAGDLAYANDADDDGDMAEGGQDDEAQNEPYEDEQEGELPDVGAYAPEWDDMEQASDPDEGIDSSGDVASEDMAKGGGEQEDAVSESSDGASRIDPDSNPQLEVEAIGGQRAYSASDNETYSATVWSAGCDPLPQGVELVVDEVSPQGMDYSEYISRSVRELGLKAEDVVFAKVLDFALVNTLTGAEYKPAQGVAASIELLDANFDGKTKLDVVRVSDDIGGGAEVVTAASGEHSVDFATGDLSTYVVCGYAQEYKPDNAGTQAIDYVTVTFKNGDRTLRTTWLISGEAIGEEAIRSGAYKANCTFKGWYRKDTGEQITASTTFDADAIAEAKFTVTVTFEADGVGKVPAPKTVDEGVAIGGLPSISKAGYRFDGWFDQDGQRVTDKSVFYGHTVLSARFVEQVTVTFVADGIYPQPVAKSLDKGVAIGNLLPVVQREGYTFRGWFNEQDNKVEATDTFYEDATLTAKLVKQVAVTFVADGEKVKTVTLDSDTPVGDKIPNGEKEGCTFKGWFIEDGEQSVEVTADSLFEEDTTATAKYTVNVTFVVNKDDGSTASSKVVELDKGAAIGNKMVGDPVKTKYRFLGWYPKGAQEPITVKTTFDQHTVVEARFVKRFTIVFRIDGLVFLSKVVDDGETVELPEAPERDDQRFDGWYDEDGTKVEESFAASADRTLTAKYEDEHVLTYTVRFFMNVDDNEKPYETLTVEAGKAVTSVASPTRDYYTFEDWYTDAKDQTNETRFVVGSATILEDTDVYAGWTLNPLGYTVRYLEQETNAELRASAMITSRAFVPGQVCTESAPDIEGYLVDESTKAVTLGYENNEIVFYYSKRTGEIQYTVNYVVYNNYEESVADSVTRTVSGDTTIVTESAVSPTEEAYADYLPIEATKTFALNAPYNVFYFEYADSGTKIAKVTVSYVDMEGDPVKAQETTYRELGSSFDIATDINGYTLDHVEDDVHDDAVDAADYTVDTEGDIGIRVFYKTNLTIRARDVSKPYDGTPLEDEGGVSSVTVSGMKEGSEHILSAITLDTGGQLDAGVGNNTPSGAVIEGFKSAEGAADPLTAEAFYNIRYIPGRTEISPVSLRITTLDAARPYDERALRMTEIRVGVGEEEERSYKDKTTYTVALVGEDEIEITVTGTQRSPGESKNTYKIKWGSVNPSNYVVTDTLGILTVSRAQIIVTAEDKMKAYGAPDPDFTVKVTRMVNGQEVEIPSTLERWEEEQYSLNLDDPDNDYIDILALAIRLEPKGDGTYAITPGAGEAAEDNYDIVYRPGTLTVVVARVSNDGGANWEYFSSFERVFARANELSGDVVVELLSDSYPYEVDTGVAFDNVGITSLTVRTTEGIGRSTIVRGDTAESLLTWEGIDGSFVLENVVVDGGGADGKSSTTPGGLIAVKDRGTLRLSNNATLQNSLSKADGGAVYIAGESVGVVVDGGEITNCSSTGSGGALFVSKSNEAGTAAPALLLQSGVISACHADKGGAIYESTNARIGFPGDAGFVIKNCTSYHEGGAIFQNDVIEMSGGEINGCSAGVDGGGIYQAAGLLVVDGGKIVGCTATRNGGAVCLVAQDGARLSNGSLLNNSVRDNGGGVYVGGSSSLTISNGVIDGCSADTGGGVYLMPGGRLTMSGGSISNNRAAGGGGVYADGNEADSACTIAVTGGVVSTNTATGNGGGVYIGRGRSASLSGFTMEGNRATATTAHDLNEQNGTGAALYVDASADVSLRDGTLKGNDAYRAGGGVYVCGGAVQLHNMTIDGNTAGCGGGIGAILKSSVTIDENTRIVSNRAVKRDSPKAGSTTIWHAGNGGGIGFQSVGEDGVLCIVGCNVAENTAENLGGGIFLDGGNSHCVLSGTSLTGNTAVSGGGVHAQIIVLKNGVSVMGNTSTGIGAGIYIGAKLILGEAGKTSGETTSIRGNLTSRGEDSNLCLARVAEGAGTPAVNAYNNGDSSDCIELLCPFVGKIYVSNPGDSGTQFGIANARNCLAGPADTDVSASVLLEEARIATDDGSGLIGRMDWDGAGNAVLRWWKQPVCKITDTNGGLLYTKVVSSEDGTATDAYAPAVYDRLYNSNGHNLDNTAFGVLNDSQTKLYTRSGGAYREYAGAKYCVKMLDDYTVHACVLVGANGRTVTFTTAETKANKVDDYYYRGQNNGIAKVSCDKTLLADADGSLFRLTNHADVVMTGIVLDGGAVFGADGSMDRGSSVVGRGNGLFANLSDSARLTVGKDATLQNAYTEACGGALCHGADSAGTELRLMDGARIYRCGAAECGGAVACLAAGGGSKTYIFAGAVIEECWAEKDGGAVYAEDAHEVSMSGGTIANCHAENGGAVYMKSESSQLAMTGGTIHGCTASISGGGIYLSGTDGVGSAKLRLSGTLAFANNNVLDWSYAGATNGNESVFDDGKVRQDVYVRVSQGTPADSILLTGNVAADAGSIWVWVESDRHCKEGQQFAVAADGVGAESYKIFRNARTDVDTSNDSLGYLTGASGAVEKWVYWSSSRPSVRVAMHKVDKDGNAALDGAIFAMLRENGTSRETLVFKGLAKPVDTVRTVAVSSRGASLNLEYGSTYYLEETTSPEGYAPKEGSYIQVAVDAQGQVVVAADGSWQEGDVTYIEDGVREAELTIKNEKRMQKVTVRKVDEDGATPLDGAEFALYRENGESRDSVRTVEVPAEGASLDLEFGGTYYLQETKAPQGYVSVADADIQIAIDSKGEVAVTADESWQEGHVVYQGTGDQTGELTIKNERAVQAVRFRKVDSFGNPLAAAATFALYNGYEDSNGAVGEAQTLVVNDSDSQSVSSATQDDDAQGVKVGDVYFKVSKGIYYMKETKAPEGYAENKDTYIVLVGEESLDRSTWTSSEASILQDVADGIEAKDYAIFLIDSKTGRAVSTPDIATYGIINEPTEKHQAVLRKVEEAGGKTMPVTGAQFDILRSDHSLVASVSSYGDDGVFWVGNLPYGAYYIHETTVPNGYDKQGDDGNWFKLTVNKDGTTCQLDEGH